ncbi:MAG: FAD binding domain-containing protein [Chloroflexi bacterium]|nr:FAD binding domain-containing protein [Chloroflexota bacterium]
MQLPRFDFIQPATIDEACSLLDERKGDATVLAGGTDLLIELRRRLRKPGCVIGLKEMRGLDYIQKDDGGDLRIGALARLQWIESSPIIAEEYPALAQATRLVAVPPIRRVATIGGNLSLDTRCIYYNQSEFWRSAQADCIKLGGDICHAVPKGRRCLAVCQSDLAPVLMALGASVKIVSAEAERTVALADFFTGKGEKPNVLAPGELLAEVIIPSDGQRAAVYEKLRIREGMDFPLAGIVVSLGTDGQGAAAGARIVLSAVGPAPTRIVEAEGLLEGKRIDDDLLEQVAQVMFERAHPVANLAMDPWYRRKMVKVLTKRAVRQALETAKAN